MTSGFDQLSRQLGAAERRLSAGPRSRVRAVLLPLATTGVVAAVLAIVLFTSEADRHRALPSGGARGASRSHSPGSWGLPCADRVGTQSPPRGLRVLLGVVALPGSPSEGRALQTGRSGGKLFAKSGLWVRGRARPELIVPAALRRRLTMSWGNAGGDDHGVRMLDPGCAAGHARWVNFVGGYWVRRPMCATLIVAAGDRRRRVRIGIGRGCPGQRPPVQPSQS